MKTTTWLVAFAALVAVVGAAACTNNPVVNVVVTPAAGLTTSSITVSVYSSATLTCDQIEYGEISDDELTGLLITSAQPGDALENLPRIGPKIFVARGYDATNTWITAGCSEVDDVTDTVSTTIATVAIATVAVAPSTGSDGGLVVSATDALHNSIDDRQVRWTVYGAAGTSADSTMFTNIEDGEWGPNAPACTSMGAAAIHPEPPLDPGGYEVRVRVSWAVPQLPLLSAFTPVTRVHVALSTTLTPDATIITWCALKRTAGIDSIVCLNDGSNATEYTYSNGTFVAGPQVALGQNSTAVVSIPNGPDLDVYAISKLGAWFAWGNAPAANSSASWCTVDCLIAPTVRELQVVPSCGGSDAGYLIGRFVETPFVRVQALLGSKAAAITVGLSAIDGAGCLSEVGSDGSVTSRQALVASIPAAAGSAGAEPTPAYTAVMFSCAVPNFTGVGVTANNDKCLVALPAGGSVGFTNSAGGANTEQDLISASFDVSGPVVSTWAAEVASDGSGAVADHLVLRTQQPAASAPQLLASGQFDTDGVTDLIWDIATRAVTDIEVSYAHQAEDEPVSAVGSVPGDTGDTPPTVLQLVAADVDNNKFDDIVIVDQTVAIATPTSMTTTTTTTTLSVIPLGIPNPPPTTYFPDTPCE